MSQKTYKVRDGYNLRIPAENGTVKVYQAGDTVTLDEKAGDKLHQLEPLKKADTLV